jgi:hypothetical protein
MRVAAAFAASGGARSSPIDPGQLPRGYEGRIHSVRICGCGAACE